MTVVTFTGETPAEALKKVQAQYGDDALVVSTKQVRKKTLTTTPLFEVVVAISEEN